MKALSTLASLVAALAVATPAPAAVAESKPFLGTWQARMTAAEMANLGYDARLAGTFKLVLARNGTYKTYNAFDGWSHGRFKAAGGRLILSDDFGCNAGAARKATYTWSVKKGVLRLSAKADPCGGRWQTLTYPLWRR